MTAYTDEAAFLADLAGLGLAVLHQGFEDDAAWGGVRTTVVGGTHTAPSVHDLGLTWLPNNTVSEITTGPGPARSGLWGFFQLPHGDPANGIRDGFGATGDQPLVAVGGWIVTNTPLATISLLLDGVPVDFGGSTAIGNQHAFFGAIAPAGFSHFEYLELEAAPDEWKLIFADDFSYAFAATIVDCNGNGVPDAADIAAGTSSDCDADGVPDECQGPDCDGNGVLDACEVVTPVSAASGPLSPFGDGAPQLFVVPAPGPTAADARIAVSARANLGGADEFVEVRLNGALLGTLFVNDGDDCPDGAPSAATLVVPQATFNALVGSGDAAIQLTASAEVDPADCSPPSWIAVELTVFAPSALDLDGDGVLDVCQGGVGASYCACDGTGAAPACANPGAAGAGCANGTFADGCALSASGAASVGADTLTLRAARSTPGQPGLFFQGDEALAGGAGLVFGDGLRCAGVNVVRLEVRLADGAGDAASTVGVAALAGLGAGDVKRYQWWYRDPQLSPCGAGFNLSNGLELVWGP